MTYVPRAGEKLRVVVPGLKSDGKRAWDQARDVAISELAKHSLKIAEFRHAQSHPWTDKLGDVGPFPNLWLHEFEAVAG